ncbi:MAG: hypothetical protein AB2A00_40535 [Myxococcota bacterium]
MRIITLSSLALLLSCGPTTPTKSAVGGEMTATLHDNTSNAGITDFTAKAISGNVTAANSNEPDGATRIVGDDGEGGQSCRQVLITLSGKAQSGKTYQLVPVGDPLTPDQGRMWFQSGTGCEPQNGQWHAETGTVTVNDVAGQRVSASFNGNMQATVNTSATGGFRLEGNVVVDKVVNF